MSFLAQSLRPLGEDKARKCLQLLIVVGRREPSPISASDLGGIGKTVAGTLASLAAASGVKELLSRDDAS